MVTDLFLRNNIFGYLVRLELILFASPERRFLLDDNTPSFLGIVSPVSNLTRLARFLYPIDGLNLRNHQYRQNGCVARKIWLS